MLMCCSEDAENQVLCKYKLADTDLTKLRDAIEDLYYFEFVIGKCPFIFTYLSVVLYYNGSGFASCVLANAACC